MTDDFAVSIIEQMIDIIGQNMYKIEKDEQTRSLVILLSMVFAILTSGDHKALVQFTNQTFDIFNAIEEVRKHPKMPRGFSIS